MLASISSSKFLKFIKSASLTLSFLLCCLKFTLFNEQADDLVIHQSMNPAEKPDNPAAVKFGHEFTDHMLEIPWNYTKGWGRPLISPVHALKLHPGAKVLHYATEVSAMIT